MFLFFVIFNLFMIVFFLYFCIIMFSSGYSLLLNNLLVKLSLCCHFFLIFNFFLSLPSYLLAHLLLLSLHFRIVVCICICQPSACKYSDLIFVLFFLFSFIKDTQVTALMDLASSTQNPANLLLSSPISGATSISRKCLGQVIWTVNCYLRGDSYNIFWVQGGRWSGEWI